MKILLPFVLFLVVFLLIDLYAFKALKLVASTWSKPWHRNVAIALYWGSSLLIYGLIVIAIFKYNTGQRQSDYYLFFMSFGLPHVGIHAQAGSCFFPPLRRLDPCGAQGSGLLSLEAKLPDIPSGR
jgi:hypothetical protein